MIGPGHGSAVLGPDNLSEYLAYHAWDVDHTGRFLHIDRLLWEEGRPVSPGPRTDQQPCPPEPLFRDLVGSGSPDGAGGWGLRGAWTRTPFELRHLGGDSAATAVIDRPAPASFLFETNLAFSSLGRRVPSYGVVTSYQDEQNHTVVSVEPDRGELTWREVRHGQVQAGASLRSLRADFSATAYHQVLLRQTLDRISVTLDGVTMGSFPTRASAGARVGVWTNGAPVCVAGVTLTDLG